MELHDRGILEPFSVSILYASFSQTFEIRYRPSQLATNFPWPEGCTLIFALRNIRSPLLKCLGMTPIICLLAFLLFKASC